MGFNQDEPQESQWIAYFDLAGGRNTKKDPHALDRNQLAAADNVWLQQGNALSKRPGSISITGISFMPGGLSLAGGTGLGVSLKGMVEGRFFGQTALVVQGKNNTLVAAPIALPGISSGVNSWLSIGTVSGGTIAATQLYDPDPTSHDGPDGALFIVTGQDVPQQWNGPGNVMKPLTYLANTLPTKTDGVHPITPAYVASLFSSLFYAGEPTDPSMLYIADPWRPQSFTSNLVIPTGTITGASYIGLPIGRGDGVNGGAITGLAPLGPAMIVYKQSAIYVVAQMGLFGDMLWDSSVGSASIGMLSPRSLVSFDTFHCILAIDGVYTYSPSNGTTKISSNNPDLFDGPTALIVDRTTAIGVRYQNKYILFFDDGAGSGVPTGHSTRGVWFDFDKLDADGLPCVGTISGFSVGGVAPLRGPADTGNFAWCDATQDRIGVFAAPVNGLTQYSDFGVAITTLIVGKADFFADIWGNEAPEMLKVLDSIHLFMSFPVVSTNQTYVFNGTVIYDQLNTLTSVGVPFALPSPSLATVGTAVVGTAVIGALSGTPSFQHVPAWQQYPSNGYIVQVSITETSTFPWTILGYNLLINAQKRVGSQTG